MMTLFADRETNVDRAALVLRLALGAIFVAHGYQKVFAMGMANVSGMMGHLGVPLPGLAGPFISLLELLGGIALLLGIFTRVFGFLLACDMLGAIVLVHGPAGFFLPKGMEFALSNLSIGLALTFLGAGAYSIDALLSRRGAPAR